jgi:hypothetical protein
MQGQSFDQLLRVLPTILSACRSLILLKWQPVPHSIYTLADLYFKTAITAVDGLDMKHMSRFCDALLVDALTTAFGAWSPHPEALTEQERIEINTVALEHLLGGTRALTYFQTCERPGPLTVMSVDAPPPSTGLPRFLWQLGCAPRAGYAKPSLPKVPLIPAESQGSHSLCVALLSILLCRSLGTDPSTSFIAALIHHVPDIALPLADHEAEAKLPKSVIVRIREAYMGKLSKVVPRSWERVISSVSRGIRSEDSEYLSFLVADVLERIITITERDRILSTSAEYILRNYDFLSDSDAAALQRAVQECVTGI